MPSAYRFPLQLRFGDVDSYGHVNNVRFLQFLEDARVHWLREPLRSADREDGPQTLADLVTEENFTLVGRHEIEYLAPLLYRREPVAVDLWVTRVGGSSFDLGYAVVDPADGAVCANCSTSMVLVSRSTGRPVRLPEAMRSEFAHFAGPDVPFRRRPPLPAEAGQP
ncbi:thioesterase family protein [Sinomonas atrocyanea]|jgi:acyl-CoA thioester hydrolase|uniref:acyl-CoA thioesterase n=1 Tax=Sinomonas atrocyanea TaxID=37927 RepID=UPI00277D97A4|nr:thioesterase family protein [Sinomonas atrocyanea]MDQ0261653.1 acyl-CoA thioester hydrolase [Sinomonas atrocyanea]MDR6623467.1 acyl-CoA thioester hydrolase [Sinomonas atrocyanea]